MKKCPECEEELEDDCADIGVCGSCGAVFDALELDEEPDEDESGNKNEDED